LTGRPKVATISKKVATKGEWVVISAGVKEVKNNLSRYLDRVKSGEEVLITERGRPVARIVKEDGAHKMTRAALAPLIQKGLIVLPSRSIDKGHLKTVDVPGKLVSAMLVEDRR
jgi:prevent-host-death family protein